MEELSRETQRWLQDILPVGRTVDPSTFSNEEDLKTLRKFTDESNEFNEKCIEGLEQLGNEYDKLSDDIESKLEFIFGNSGLNDVLNDTNLAELDWLVSIAMLTNAESTDEDKMLLAIKNMDDEITLKKQTLSQLKDDTDHFRKVESQLSEMKTDLERALRKIEMSNESQKARMAENMTSLNTLSKKKKQYQKSTAKVEQELIRRNIQPSMTSATLFEQQKRIEQLKERATSLENALRHYCGLPTDKQEAQKQLNELAEKLNKVDMKLIEKMRDQ